MFSMKIRYFVLSLIMMSTRGTSCQHRNGCSSLNHRAVSLQGIQTASALIYQICRSGMGQQLSASHEALPKLGGLLQRDIENQECFSQNRNSEIPISERRGLMGLEGCVFEGEHSRDTALHQQPQN